MGAIAVGSYIITPGIGMLSADNYDFTTFTSGTLTITNLPPVAEDVTASTDRETPVTIDVLASDSDPDGDTVSVQSVTDPADGTAVISPDGTITYTPATNFQGTDSFQYTISDSHGATATANVTVTVNHVVETRHWTGGGGADNLWSDAANWNLPPEPGDNLAFDGTPEATVNDLPADTAFGAIQFLSPSGPGTGRPDWQVAGNEVVLGGADAILVAPNQSGSTVVVDFNLPVLLGSDMTAHIVSSASSMDMAGDINIGGYTLSLDDQGSGVLQVAGAITGSGGVTTSDGPVLLNGSNSYTGSTSVQSGTLTAFSGSALGNTSSVEVGPVATLAYEPSLLAASLVLDAGATVNLMDSAVVSGPIVSHGGVITGSGTITGPISVDGNLTFSYAGVSVSGDVGEISPGSSITIEGDSTSLVTLGGTSTYTGTTDVQGGTLEVDGALQGAGVEVNGGATLDGVGTINAPVSVDGGGTLEPFGLTVGDLTMSPSSTFVASTTAPTEGQPSAALVANGSVNLGGATLEVLGGKKSKKGGGGSTGVAFTQISNVANNPVIGTFAGLPEGTILAARSTEFLITYQGGAGNDVVLTTVAPTAADQAYSCFANGTLTVSAPGVLAGAMDPSGAPLSAQLNAGPSDGSLQLNADGSFTYTPDAGFVGTVSFTYFVTDGTATSDAATVTLTVNGAVDTTTAVQSSEDPSQIGDSITFTATVSAASGSDTATGSVQFSIDGAAAGGPISLSGDSATFTTSALAVGGHSVTAAYTPDTVEFSPSSGAVGGGQTVDPADTSIAIASSVPTSVYGQSVTWTATVVAVTPGLPTPTGSAQFEIDGSPFGTAVSLVNGAATSPAIDSLGAGDHTITVVYSGDGVFATSTSAGLTQSVNPATLAVSADDATKVYGQPNPTFTASYDGFVLGEDPSVLGGALTFMTSATTASHVQAGGYSMSPDGLTSTNYAINFVPGTLTITPAPLSITADAKTMVFARRCRR